MDKKSKNIRSQKIFIEPLEQRIMLDGAGASTFLDLIDERNQQEIKKNSWFSFCQNLINPVKIKFDFIPNGKILTHLFC